MYSDYTDDELLLSAASAIELAETGALSAEVGEWADDWLLKRSIADSLLVIARCLSRRGDER